MVERRSIGSRILSALLAVCLLVSMVPSTALSVFAADSATVTNVNTIRDYAESLLNSNFSKAASEDADSKNDKFTWDTEGKTTNWRYYNGVMLDALLMLGVDSSAGNALEFAKDFMDTNTEDASKAVTHYITKEVDSVPPALVLFDLLNTAEVTESDRAIYVKAINYVYGQLEAQTSYDQCGGNLLHKMENDSWATWNIGLDGIYMAQPFYMEYANALAKGEITNTVNSKSASDIYKEVYDRLMWVADNMYDSATGLYHHGWNVADSEGNGHFWSRGIGWYAAGLVMCIDLMPEGQYKTDLIAKAVKVFDGMLPYQDASGLWYNVVNRNSSLTANNGNKLEASGTALMAYAMMKAYNEDWVTDSKYATAAEKGFNGIVSAMESGKIVNIYKSSGVCTNDDDYCKNDYVSDEAKGVGPVLMAAAEVSKYADVEEEFNIGVVVAPEMTIAEGTTQLTDTAGIKATLVSNHGTVANGVASSLTYNVGSTSNGKATVTVKNGDYTIDTFQVNVADPNTPATGTGTLEIEDPNAQPDSSAPSFTAGNFVLVQEAVEGGGDSTKFTRVTSLTVGKAYVFTKNSTGNTVNGAGASGGSLASLSVTGTKTANDDGTYTLAASSGSLTYWYVDSNNRIYTEENGTKYYVKITGTSANNRELTTTESDGTVFTFSNNNDTVLCLDSSKNRNLVIDSSGLKTGSNSTSNGIYVYQQNSGDSTATPAVYGQLVSTGSTGLAYPFETGSATVITDLQNSTAFKVLVADNASGTGATELAMNSSRITIEKNSDYKKDEAKVNNFTVKLDGKVIGTIPVKIYDDSASTASYEVSLSVTPGAIVANVGDGNTQLNPTVTVSGLSGYGYYVTYSTGNNAVATVSDSGQVTIVGAGSTTVTATVQTITYGGTSYDSSAFGTVTASIPVVVSGEAVAEPVTYQMTGIILSPATIAVGETAQATGYAKASDGSDHGYTFTWKSYNTDVATVDYYTGVITAKSEGTASIEGYLTAVDGNGSFTTTDGNLPYLTATITVTAAAAPEPTIASYSLGISNLTFSESDLDANGYVTEEVMKAAIKAANMAANGSDKETVTLTWTYTDGTTGSAELVAGSGKNIPLVVSTHSNGARYVGVWYNDLGYNSEIGVTIEAAEYTYTILGSNGSALAGQNITLNEGDTYTPSFSVSTNGSDVTGSYSMTLTATSNASAVTISGTTITANKVNSDTVVNITATVTPNSRATAEGTSVNFTVTVKAADDETTVVTTPSSSGDWVLFGTETTTNNAGGGNTYTHNFTANGTTSTYYKFSTTNTSTSYGTTTTPDGVTSSAALKIAKGSTNVITFTASTSGTLTIVAASGSNDGSPLTVNGTEYALQEDKGITTITVDLSAGDCEIGANTKDAYVFYISFAESSGSGSGEPVTTNTDWAQLVKVDYTLPVNAVTTSDLLAQIKSDNIIKTAKDANGNTYNGTNLTWEDSYLVWDTALNTAAAGTYTATVKIPMTNNGQATGETATLGTITVTVTGVACTHNYTSSVTTAATCTTDGVRTYTCSECGDSYTETIAAIGHSYSSAVTTQPGCETNGVRTYTCSNDNSHTYTEAIAATGHSWNSGTVTTEPTCTATGVKTYTCTNDGSHTKTETVAALGHSYSNGTCTVCGAADPNYQPPSGGNKYTHNFTTDGDTDPDEYFTISGNYSNTAATIDGTSYTRGMKLESSAGTVTFTAASAGTLTLHIATGTSSVKIDGKNYDVTNGVFTIDLEAGSHTIAKGGSGGGPLYYIEYAEEGPAVTYTATLTLDSESGSMYVGNNWTLTPTVVITDSNGNTVDNATYTVNWSSNSSAVTVNGGKVYAAGVASGAVVTASISEITVGGNSYSVSASDTCTFTTTIKTVSTGSQWANAGDLVSFTVAGSIPDGSWGNIDNVKVYKDGTLVTTVTDASCWNAPEGFTVNDGALDLWMENGGSGTATYSFIAENAGNYTVEYELIGDWTVTEDATITETLTAQAPTYTYELYAPDGTLLTSNSGLRFEVEVGDTWTPYVVVTRNDGVDVSSEYELRFPDYLYSSFVTFDGDTVTAVAVNEWVYLDSVSVYNKSTNTAVQTWTQPCILNVIEAIPDLWVDASNGWRPNFSEAYTLDSSTQTWTYTSVTNDASTNWWDVSNVTIYDSEGKEMGVIRADAYGWSYDSSTNTSAELVEVGTQNNLPDTWLTDNKEGVTVKVTAKLDGDYIIIVVSNSDKDGNELATNSYVLYNRGTGAPTIKFTGENCKLYDPETTTEHLDTSSAESAVDRLEALDMSLTVADIWIARDQTGTASPVVLDGEEAITYNVVYAIISGTSASLSDGVFTAKTLGATNAIAYVNSVTVDGVVTPVTNVSDTFVVNTVPWWEPKTTNTVTPAAGDTVIFTYGGNMPGVAKGAGYVDEVTIYKVDSNGTATVAYSTNFNNGTEGWTFENGFGDIQNEMDTNRDGKIADGDVYRSLRLYRSSGQAYQGLAASYSITAEEGYSYYATYIQMIESTDGIGNMTGTMSFESNAVGSVYIHNFTEHDKNSEFYTITGSLSTSKGSTAYNDETLTQCLKMESGTNIAFTAENAGTLTLVFGGTDAAAGKKVKIDGTSYTVGDDGTLTVELAAGEHTITKGDSINLFYMAYAEKGSTGGTGGSGGTTGGSTTVRYELYTGNGSDIANDDIFLIVNEGQTIALMNDDDGESGDIAGLSAAITIDGSYAIIGSADEPYATWKVSGWKEGTKEDLKYYSMIFGNGSRFIQDSSSKILQDTGKTLYLVKTETPGKYALAAGVAVSDGELVANGNHWFYDATNNIWTKNKETIGYVYLYKQTVITSGVTVSEPGRLYIGGTSSMPTVDLAETVTVNGATLGTDDYSITWSIVSGGDYIDLDTASGLVTAKKGGTAVVRATVTVGEGDSAVTYTDDVNVTVVNPGVTVTEELSLIHGVAGSNTGSTATVVTANNTNTNNYKVTYLSSNTNVATVDDSGNITTVGKGTATITATLTEVNGLTVSQLGIKAATTVTVTEKEVATATLNTYDYVVQKGASESELQTVLEHMILSVNYNTGDSFTAQYGTDTNLKIDLATVNTSEAGRQYAIVTYTDAEGKEIFRDTVWIHVEEFDPDDYDGVVTEEMNITFILDDDGVNVNKEYVIVANGYAIALLNPSATSDSCGAATTGSVTISGNTLTMAESNAPIASWLIDTPVNVTIGGNTVAQYNASNFLRYLGIDDNMMLIHYNVEHVYITHLGNGEYQIVLSYNDDGTPAYYLTYDGSKWTASTTASSVYLYRKEAIIEDYTLNFELNPTTASIPEGFTTTLNTTIKYNKDTVILDPSRYQIVWSSSNTNVATVDQKGNVTGVSEGTATITAKLVAVDGFEVIDNETDLPYIIETATVTVVDADPVPVLTPSSLTIGVGSMPNLNKVNVKMTYGADTQYDQVVTHELLTFHMADAEGTLSDGTEVTGFSSAKPGVFTVQVEYAGQKFPLTIRVDEDPYAGLDPADSIPGYPDAGAVRMDKTATGVIDFNSTGLVKLELTAAGISTKSSVDVVLVVDVSNSMAWSMDWFSEEHYNAYLDGLDEDADEMTYDEWVKASRDPAKIPAVNDDNTINGATKLDMAMDSASAFADILLNVEGGDNTLTFVTFAGNDEEHGGIDGNMDSVRTPFVGVTDYNTAKGVFDATEFTHLVVDGNSVGYYLNIGGSTANGYGDASVTSGYGSDDALKNRGNTNYDYAFGEATDAVADLKAQYKANTGKDYDSSDRQLYVVFMTDGAPSAYNGIYLNGKNSDTMYANTKGNGDDDKGDAYSQSDDADSESEWLTHIKGYHNLATSLEEEIYGYYTVGFDLAHGGFGDYSWHEDDMERVLSGMVRNSVVPVTMATDEAQLNAFYTNLAKALAYAGTNAKVTDQIGSEFSLFTGVHMYADNIVELTQGGEHALTTETFTALGEMDFSVEILSYRLVLAADIGDELSVIDTDGTVKTVTVSNEHLGLRVNEAPKVIETITFSYDEGTDTTAAYSDVIGEDENIMSTAGDGAVTINANYFTYTSTLETDENGKAITSENIIWKIGDITDREIAMSYYAYLEGSLDGSDVSEGMYQTNEFAYLEYIDVYGDYVKRNYGIPEVAWGKAGVTVRFYLVNEQGRFVNRAGVPFDNPANRIFLDGRTIYSTDLNNFVEGKEKLVIDALKALTAAGLANNELYDTDLELTVTTDYASKQQGGVIITDYIKENIATLVFINDVMNDGSYANTIIDIPVILSDLGMSVRPLAGSTVVMDYGKPMDISVFSSEEMNYVKGWHDYRNGDDSGKQYIYDMTVVGFAEYSSQFDQRTYVEAGKFQNTLTTNNGSYQVTSANGETQIRFTPSGMLDEVETVFVVVKFQEYNDTGVDSQGNYKKDSPTDQYYYMYKQLNIVPATVMYYETDFAGGVFTTGFSTDPHTGTWATFTDGVASNESQNVYEAGGIYGFDSTYDGDNRLSNGTSLKATVGHDTSELDFASVSFTFTGDGFDIISRTGKEQTTICVTYTNVETGESKSVTVINKGVNELYQIPVVSVNDLTYGTYEVYVEAYEGYTPNSSLPENLQTALYRGNEFYFDAVRIHNPMRGSETISKAELVNNNYTTTTYTVNSVYGSDGEYDPTIKEVGKLLIDAETFNATGDSAVANGVLYLDDEGSLANGSTNAVDTYDEIGPNHEVYLSKGSGIAFILNVSDLANLASIDIAAKTVDGSAPVLKTVIHNKYYSSTKVEFSATVNSATAQYYSLLPSNAAFTFTELFTTPDSKNEVYVIIVNASESESVLSLTDLKIAFSGGTSAVETLYSLDLAEVAAPYVSRRFAPVIALDLAEDGNWYYYVNGEVDYGYTGLQRNDFGTWYVKNGQIDFGYNGLVSFEGETFYIRGGRVSTESNGLHYVEGEWRYFTEGMVDTAFTGLAANDFGTWYVENGMIDFSMVGLAENNGELWYVRYGQYLSTYTGLVYHNGLWLYVGSGVVDYTYTGLAYNSIGWWYVENGTINFNYTGVSSNETGTYYVKYGQVDFTVTVE